MFKVATITLFAGQRDRYPPETGADLLSSPPELFQVILGRSLIDNVIKPCYISDSFKQRSA